MALEYQLYCDLGLEELQERIDAFMEKAQVGRAWTYARASSVRDLSRELRREEGFDGPFEAYAYIRVTKDGALAGTGLDLVVSFYETLPAPKVVLIEGSPYLDGRFAPSPMPPEDRITEGWRSGGFFRRQAPAAVTSDT